MKRRLRYVWCKSTSFYCTGTMVLYQSSVLPNDFISNHSFTIFAKCEFNVNSYCAAVFRKHCNSGNL